MPLAPRSYARCQGSLHLPTTTHPHRLNHHSTYPPAPPPPPPHHPTTPPPHHHHPAALLQNPVHWEAACRALLASKQDLALERSTVLRHHNGSWKRMFLENPHVRFDGVYVCRNTYIRTGGQKLCAV
jgi:hypothetical protein